MVKQIGKCVDQFVQHIQFFSMINKQKLVELLIMLQLAMISMTFLEALPVLKAKNNHLV